MQKEITFYLSPEEAANSDVYINYLSQFTGVKKTQISYFRLLKRTIDARSRNIKIHLTFEVFIDELPPQIITEKRKYIDVSNKKAVVIVGAGPAGLFAALKLIELGIKPVIIERGKDVHTRKLDIASLNRENLMNEESNYCFGEGGAGTFSDGKLYTRSTKRGNVKEILDILIEHGASEEICIDAHPHIGTDKLPKIISNIRETIVNCGGEYHFNSKVTDLIIENSIIRGVVTNNKDSYFGESVILATGHSASDVYHLLQEKKVALEVKPFAIGVRVEHQQQLIDSIQYHQPERGNLLPAASYNVIQQVEGRGVFSFCMCPGGIIVPASTGKEQVVVNGMSNSQRNSPFANAGIVVGLEVEDFSQYSEYGALAGLYFQSAIEKAAFNAGGKTQTAPAQRMVDFVNDRTSANLPPTSYIPGIVSASIKEILPHFITSRLKLAFKEFNNKMKGFYTNEAVLLGVETRTSSPVRIPRDKETLEHIQIKNLFPCGEGSGYAGGIVSSAIDGVRCAEKVVERINNK
ncbi:MAG: FAD-binding protein [Bacteroidetes bacterium CG2_30_32_10]|nr:MAG: FAD-binding protein [Bacteroidetes bacterium CG2_30_32_10]